MNDSRRRFLGGAVAAVTTLDAASANCQTLAASASRASAAEGTASATTLAAVLPKPIARLTAGQVAAVKLDGLVRNFSPGITQLRLRANLVDDPVSAQRDQANAATASTTAGGATISFESQFREFSFDGRTLHFDGSPFPALSPGASAARLQLEATNLSFDKPSAVVVSDIAWIVVDTPLALIKHGLDVWENFDAVTRSVLGTASAGSAPNGRTDLIGQTFTVTPGMFSEGYQTRLGAPVATIEFPCVVRAADPIRRPVFRSVTGRRDIVQIEARQLPPINGEVVLQDLVIRDNRAWYDSGEAGIRIKDKFAGRSVRIERCEIVRCQNAVAGGTLGQTLRIVDCRVVDCGFADRAHAFYLAPEWLEFFGNLVTFSPGNRLARAHLLKSRALNARILGNRFVMGDCPASYLIDLSNGGDVEIGGNLLHYGPVSDNSVATLVSFAAEGANADFGPAPYTLSPGRRFKLSARNNSLLSEFPGSTQFFVIHDLAAARAEGGRTSTFPTELVIEDNVLWSRGVHSFAIRSNRNTSPPTEQALAALYARNMRLRRSNPVAADGMQQMGRVTESNSAGTYVARRFTGDTDLGTGSQAHAFVARGAG